MRDTIDLAGLIRVTVSDDLSLPLTLYPSTSRSTTKFGEYEAAAKLRNATIVRGMLKEEELLGSSRTISYRWSGFLAAYRVRSSVSSFDLFIFFPFSFSTPPASSLFLFVYMAGKSLTSFSREDTRVVSREIIFSSSIFLSLPPASARIPLVQSKTCTRALWLERERECDERAERGRGHCVEVRKGREIYFYGRDSDVFFFMIVSCCKKDKRRKKKRW